MSYRRLEKRYLRPVQ